MMISMSFKFKVSGGTYNVRQSELRRDVHPVSKMLRCRIYFLDDSEANFEIEKQSTGQVLLEKVFEHLELIEKDYFGLEFSDCLQTEQMRWLDPVKAIRKQIPGDPPYVLYFKVKFYASDPSKLREEYTRYHLYLQLKRDMLEGRLVVPQKSATLLASYAVQSEFGDFNYEEHANGYLSVLRFLPKQTEEFEREVGELHRQHRGQTPADAELNYLEHAKRLDMYGTFLFSAQLKDKSNREIQLGVSSVGLVLFQNNTRINTFAWSKVAKISFKRNQFFIRLQKETAESSGSSLIGFNMNTYRQCKNLWKACVEHHTFFRLQSSPMQQTSTLFPFHSKFRYRFFFASYFTSGRTEYEAVAEVKKQARISRTFKRSPSKHFTRRTIAVMSCETVSNKRSSSAAPLDYSLTSSVTSSVTRNSVQLHGNGSNTSCVLARRQPVLAWTSPTHVNQQHEQALPKTRLPETKSSNVAVAILQSQYKPSGNTVLSRTNHGNTQLDDRMVSLHPQTKTSSTTNSIPRSSRIKHEIPQESRTDEDILSKQYSINNNESHVNGNRNSKAFDPRTVVSLDWKANGDAHAIEFTSPGESQDFFLPSTMSSLVSSSHCHAFREPPNPVEEPLQVDSHLLKETAMSGNSLVTVRMKPDAQGRFGFNVKGGADQNLPIIVSRVAPNTPADLCIPRLNEGDQVLFINGRDISSLSHEQVVNFIRASREPHSGELILTVRSNEDFAPRVIQVVQLCRNLRHTNRGEMVLVVRSNVYITEDVPDEPDFQFIPDSEASLSLSPASCADPLTRSLQLLEDGLTSGTVMTQFEQLHRKKPGMTREIARLAENQPKNRYRDISPYDLTRVKLKNVTGDYINANYVNMEIASAGIVNRYIAAQGPLYSTTADFWQMTWQQKSSLIVMLTTQAERGRVKCHQYWPDLHSGPAVLGHLAVTTIKEEITPSFAFRDFTLICTENLQEEERYIRQMQYMAWPDHGVPDDSSDFLDFVIKVRQNRTGMVEPTIVHCSAGIGRTGVLITMETAMCLIEANQPVYPLDIVRQMRDQRAMLIQTPSQFRFVCEAILKVYNDGTTKPLQELK